MSVILNVSYLTVSYAGLPAESLLKKELLSDSSCKTPGRPKPELSSESPRYAAEAEVTSAAKAMSEVASQLTAAMTVFNSQLKESPKLVDPCKATCRTNSPRISPFHGFTSSDVASTAAPDGLLQYMKARDANAGLAMGVSVPGIDKCLEPIPSAPVGSHVHHVYVEDAACQHDAGGEYIFAQKNSLDAEGGVDGTSDSGSSDSSTEEEEIRVKEKRECIVTMGKKRTKGKPVGSKAKYQRM